MFRNKYLLIFLVVLSGYGGSASNTTLQLPITITPLVQDAVQQGDLTKALIQAKEIFFENVTFSDIVKALSLHKTLLQLEKDFAGIVVLGLAAQAHGLTVEKFEFVQPSKWTITMSVEELANVSNITLPLNDTVLLIAIQEAMFEVLEKRFNFKTEEIAERFNTTKEEIYAFLEPGWIKVVNFITEKNILALSTNYTIPPFYIAEALNMSLSELYNSTLPQLEDILVNKIDIIEEAAERWKRIVSSSIAALPRVTSTVSSAVMSTMLPINSTESNNMKQTTTTVVQPHATSQTEMKTSSIVTGTSPVQKMLYTSSSYTDTLASAVVSTMLPKGRTESIMMKQTTTMAIEPRITSQVSSSLVTGISTVQKIMYTSSSYTDTLGSSSTIALQISPTNALQSSSIADITSSNVPPVETQRTMSSSIKMKSSSVPEKKTSTPSTSRAQPITSTSMTYVSMTTQVQQKEHSSTLPIEMMSSHQELSTTRLSMFQSTTTTVSALPTSTEIVSTLTIISKSSIISESSKMLDFLTSKSSDLLQSRTSEIIATSSNMMKISSTQHTRASEIQPTQSMDKSSTRHVTSTARLPTTTMIKSSSIMIKSSSSSSSAQSHGLETPISSTGTSGHYSSKTVKIDEIKSSSVARTTSITTAFVLMTSSSQPLTSSTVKIILPTTKLSSSPQLTTTTHYSSYVTTSSHLPINPKTSSSQSVLDTSSSKTGKVSTDSRYQQTSSIPESSLGHTSTADAFVMRTTISIKPSTYHATSSHVPVTTTSVTPIVGNTPDTRSKDDIDPVVLIVVPIMCVLVLVAAGLAFFMWRRRKRQQKSAGHRNGESGSELSTKGLTESLESINNNRTTGFSNRGADDRSSRSMSRSSSISNLGTIYEGKEPEEPEIYDL